MLLGFDDYEGVLRGHTLQEECYRGKSGAIQSVSASA
jgi:hypothetical protein